MDLDVNGKCQNTRPGPFSVRIPIMFTIRYLIVLVALATALPASAVCLDPKTFISGYHLPLDEEVHSTKFIAIGKITAEKALQEDSSDPDGITSHIYSVQIIRQLKGSLPNLISIKVENDSGRYLMDVGEEHLLFLAREKKYYSVDSCGNSSVLPGSNDVLKQVEENLRRKSNAP